MYFHLGRSGHLQLLASHSGPSGPSRQKWAKDNACREQYLNELTLRSKFVTEAQVVARVLQLNTAEQSEEINNEVLWEADSSKEAINRLKARVQAVMRTDRDSQGGALCQEMKTMSGKAAELHAASADHQNPEISTQVYGHVIDANRRMQNRRRFSRQTKREQSHHCAVQDKMPMVSSNAQQHARKRRLQSRSTRSFVSQFQHTHEDDLHERMSDLLEESMVHKARRLTKSDALDILLGNKMRLLSRQEEVHLIHRMQGGLQIQKTIKEIKVMANSEDDASMLMSSLRMDMDEIIETLRKGFQAQYILMHANKRLVFKLAHTFGFDKMVPFEDYVMAGMDGLMTGLLKFDPSRGSKLSSLLTWWIRTNINMLVEDLAHVISIPKHIRYGVIRFQKQREALTVKLGRPPTDAELQEILGLTQKQYLALEKHSEQIQKSSEDCASPSGSQIDFGTELTVGDLIHATEDDNPVRKLNERAMQECLDKLLSTFCPRNAGIIRALYNLEEHTDQMTLQKHVGLQYNLTSKTIAHIRNTVITKLRETHSAELQDVLMDY